MNMPNSTQDFSGLLGSKQIDVLSILYIVLLSLSSLMAIYYVSNTYFPNLHSSMLSEGKCSFCFWIFGFFYIMWPCDFHNLEFITGSFSVLLVSTIKWRHLRGQVHLLVQLSLADLLAAIVLMCTSVINKVHPFSAVICPYLLPLSLTFYFISFMLAIVYALKSRNAMQGWRDRAADEEDEHSQCRRKIKAIPLYVLVWLAPLAIYFVYVCTLLIKPATLIPASSRSQDGLSDNGSSYCSSCILFLHVWKDPCVGVDKIHDTFIRVFLAIVVITAMLSCSVIYWKIGKWHEQYMQVGLFPVDGDGHLRRQLKRVFSTARNIVMVIIFCWAPALLLLLIAPMMIHMNVKQDSLYGLYLIQAATVSLQGFLNSMVYAWRRPNFTEAVLGEITPLLRYKQKTPYFEESFHC